MTIDKCKLDNFLRLLELDCPIMGCAGQLAQLRFSLDCWYRCNACSASVSYWPGYGGALRELIDVRVPGGFSIVKPDGERIADGLGWVEANNLLRLAKDAGCTIQFGSALHAASAGQGEAG